LFTLFFDGTPRHTFLTGNEIDIKCFLLKNFLSINTNTIGIKHLNIGDKIGLVSVKDGYEIGKIY